MSTLVTSPAGEQIEVVERETALQWANVGPLVESLWCEGAFIDASGQASRPWFEAARRRGYSAKMSAITSYFHRGLGQFVDREIASKRCYEIRLRRIPQRWSERLAVTAPSAPAVPSLLSTTMSSKTQRSNSSRPVGCPLCDRSIGLNNLHKHLTGRHKQSYPAATELVRQARQGARHLPAVVESNGHGETAEPIDLRATSMDLLMAMVSGVRHDNVVPIRALPSLQDWLAVTERTLAQVVD